MHGFRRPGVVLWFAIAGLAATAVTLSGADVFPESPAPGALAIDGIDFAPAGSEVGSLDIPAGLTREEVREVVIISVVARRYTLQAKSDRHVVGHLIHRGHEVTLTFVIHPQTISIHCEGYSVRSNGARRKPETPHAWINNLRNDITKRMALKLATK